MGLPRKLLGRDEVVVKHMHTHVKALFLAGLFLVLLIAVLVLGLMFMPESLKPWGTWALVVLVIIGFLWGCVLPWLRWLTNTYTVTNRRIITRSGIIAKTGNDIPLARISNVSYEHDLIDRIFGCGTLVIKTSAQKPLYLHDIPSVEERHVELTELLFGRDQRNADFAADD